MSKSPEQLEMDIAEFLAFGGRVVSEQTAPRATKPTRRMLARASTTKGTKLETPTRSAAKKPKNTPPGTAQLDRKLAGLRAGTTRHLTSGANPGGVTDPIVLVREGNGWRQYFVIGDERVAIVHMKPALLGGWRFHRVEVQGKHDWPRMKRDAIVEWKFHADDGRTRVAEGLGDFRERLLEVARSGQL
jgi:hypothetical protein